ncbi:hypothetical protein BV20DRAFT_857574 [Pilatotrama ljubarskyi]|nr:hypothetical protein BV20DRAFT_857574 [Pilatotrama ljubarskyi]
MFHALQVGSGHSASNPRTCVGHVRSTVLAAVAKPQVWKEMHMAVEGVGSQGSKTLIPGGRRWPPMTMLHGRVIAEVAWKATVSMRRRYSMFGRCAMCSHACRALGTLPERERERERKTVSAIGVGAGATPESAARQHRINRESYIEDPMYSVHFAQGRLRHTHLGRTRAIHTLSGRARAPSAVDEGREHRPRVNCRRWA